VCGIGGLVGLSRQARAKWGESLITTLRHRGPDDSGVWQDDEGEAMLGQARLSIIDCSPAGHQPMISACGRLVMTLNGEIYNHQELRLRLGPRRWRGHSDTEVLLECFAHWGVERTLRATVGMFALGLWDRESHKLVIARDRLGEKPLYYGYVGGAFAFASELKALRTLPGFTGEVDRHALDLFMQYGAIPAPSSIYKGISKLSPGTWSELSTEARCHGAAPRSARYWSALDAAEEGVRTPLHFDSDDQAVDALGEVLGNAVTGEMMSDVPLGAFLSGGVDSSAIVALMQAASSRPVRTFSIGFREGAYNEARHAAAVAAHLGTNHTELLVTAEDSMGVISKLPSIYDEPFADSSQIPTYLVAKLAREHVTVALSGDGGDEVFGGYNRYRVAAGIASALFKVPRPLRRLVAAGVTSISPAAWDSMIGSVNFALGKRSWMSQPGEQLHKGAAVLAGTGGPSVYRRLTTHWDPGSVVLNGGECVERLETRWPNLPTLAEQMMAMDSITYLPDDNLAKVDRAAMAVGLETRVPFLSRDVFEFAWRLPLNMKIRGGEMKWLLRQLLYRHVPRALIDRPKMGFGVPIDSWLRGPLRDWAEALLDERRLREEGYLQPLPVRQKWREHLSGKRNWQHHLWDVLMFQMWLERQETALHDVSSTLGITA
jgi:asparagine synthase (glutamine-hydrolysing)